MYVENIQFRLDKLRRQVNNLLETTNDAKLKHEIKSLMDDMGNSVSRFIKIKGHGIFDISGVRDFQIVKKSNFFSRLFSKHKNQLVIRYVSRNEIIIADDLEVLKAILEELYTVIDINNGL